MYNEVLTSRKCLKFLTIKIINCTIVWIKIVLDLSPRFEVVFYF